MSAVKSYGDTRYLPLAVPAEASVLTFGTKRENDFMHIGVANPPVAWKKVKIVIVIVRKNQ